MTTLAIIIAICFIIGCLLAHRENQRLRKNIQIREMWREAQCDLEAWKDQQARTRAGVADIDNAEETLDSFSKP